MSPSPAFLIASLLLAVTPGPGVFYIVTRSASQGRAAGLASVAGVACGNLGNAVAASLGLATLFALSAVAFTVVKYAGAIYLIYLGARTLLSRSPPPVDGSLPEPVPLRRLYVDGFLVALFNPKTALFFAAFVPQFLDRSSASAGDVVSLGVVFVLIAAATDSIYALVAGSIRQMLGGTALPVRAGRLASGSAFIALGLFTAFSDRRHT
jgi:threonine/homoserine/homoserine lactone efflux protein